MKLYKLLQVQSFFILFFGIGLSTAQVPSGYYSTAEGLTGESLKSALNDIIDDHVKFSYTSSNTDVWDILKETDRDTIDPTKVILIYTGWTVDAEQEYNAGSGWTREHVWAKSRGNFGTSQGAGTDVHALRPCDVSVNSARNNRWFGIGEYEYIDGDGPTGCYTSTSSWVWEPRDEVKGDIARMMFYMDTRYEGENGELDLQLIDSIPSDNNTNEPIHGLFSVLRQWHIDDPVDDWERNRNDVIYSYQGNRNPFIDHPEFVGKIWGHVLDEYEIGFKDEIVSTSSLSKEQIANSKELVMVVDALGREVEIERGVLQFYIYSDGSVEKRVLR